MSLNELHRGTGGAAPFPLGRFWAIWRRGEPAGAVAGKGGAEYKRGRRRRGPSVGGRRRRRQELRGDAARMRGRRPMRPKPPALRRGESGVAAAHRLRHRQRRFVPVGSGRTRRRVAGGECRRRAGLGPPAVCDLSRAAGRPPASGGGRGAVGAGACPRMSRPAKRARCQ